MRIFGKYLMAILAAVLITLTTLLLYHHLLTVRHPTWTGTRLQHDNGSWTGYLVSSPTCTIPDIDPFDPEVARLYWVSGQLDCGFRKPALVGVSFAERILWLEGGVALDHYGEPPDRVRCRVSVIERDQDGRSDDNVTVMSEGVVLTSAPTVIEHEFVRVYCENFAGSYLYSDYFAFIVKKDNVEERVRRPPLPVIGRNRTLGAILLAIDGVSRLNFLRHLPLTLDYLTSGPMASRVVQLTGYTKMGDNTLPNILAILTGLSLPEVNATLGTFNPRTHFDVLDFLWKHLTPRGIRTLLAEDDPTRTAFNYLKAGFHYQPTDYYYRPLTLVSEPSRMRAESTNPHCFNNRTELQILLQWLHDFMETFSHDPLFAFTMFTRLTHDELNYAGYVDQPLVEFLNKVIESQLLDRSVLFLFSDHGSRFGPLRQTHVGWMEERLPFMFIVVPPWFAAEYPAWWRALRRNQRRLSTPFDLHATLRHMFHLPDFIGTISNARGSNSRGPNARGLSLLNELPENRTCKQAGIDSHWCTCQKRRPIRVDDVHVKRAAGHVMNAIEKILVDVSDVCAALTMTRLVHAEVSYVDDSRNPGGDDEPTKIADYLLTIVVSPGGAWFEATVRFWRHTSVYETMGYISRTNRYGDQSWCVSSAQLKLYCYCIDQSGGVGSDTSNETVA